MNFDCFLVVLFYFILIFLLVIYTLFVVVVVLVLCDGRGFVFSFHVAYLTFFIPYFSLGFFVSTSAFVAGNLFLLCISWPGKLAVGRTSCEALHGQRTFQTELDATERVCESSCRCSFF